MLSEEKVKSYQELYKSRFGKEISYEEAYEQGTKLLRLVEIIYKPMAKVEYQELQERREQIKNTQISCK